MVTVVVAVACLPRSSTALQVTVIDPAGAPLGNESRGCGGSGDLSGRGRIGVADGAVLRTACDRCDGCGVRLASLCWDSRSREIVGGS